MRRPAGVLQANARGAPFAHAGPDQTSPPLLPPPASALRLAWSGCSGDTQVLTICDLNLIRSPTFTGRLKVTSSTSTAIRGRGGAPAHGMGWVELLRMEQQERMQGVLSLGEGGREHGQGKRCRRGMAWHNTAQPGLSQPLQRTCQRAAARKQVGRGVGQLKRAPTMARAHHMHNQLLKQPVCVQACLPALGMPGASGSARQPPPAALGPPVLAS